MVYEKTIEAQIVTVNTAYRKRSDFLIRNIIEKYSMIAQQLINLNRNIHIFWIIKNINQY